MDGTQSLPCGASSRTKGVCGWARTFPLTQPRQYALAVASAGAASLSLNGERIIAARELRLRIGVYGAES